MGLNENEVTRPIVRYYMAFKLDFSDNWKNYPSRYQLFRCLLFFSYRHENQYTKTMEALSILWLLSFCQSILISKWLYDADLNPLRDALVQHLKGFWQPRQCNNLHKSSLLFLWIYFSWYQRFSFYIIINNI